MADSDINYKEEQSNEMIVLHSMFPDQYTHVDANQFQLQFHPHFQLEVTYSEKYPQTQALILLTSPLSSYFEEVKIFCSNLQNFLELKMQEMIGQSMILSIIDSALQYIQENEQILTPYFETLQTSTLEAKPTTQKKKKSAAANQSTKSSQSGNNRTKNEDAEEKRHPFKGSDLIFERIKWDNSIPKDQINIGYLDRFVGIKEIAFSSFKTSEDYEGVPMHRIRYFKLKDTIIWDREKRIDLITGKDLKELLEKINGSTTSIAKGDTKLIKQEIPCQCFCFDSKQKIWLPYKVDANFSLEMNQTLRCVTWNVLFDNHLSDQIHTKYRIPHLLKLLQQTNAHVITLQEVTADFLHELMLVPWIQESYFIMGKEWLEWQQAPETHFGQVILTKFPLSQGKCIVFSKSFLIGQLNNQIQLVALHLTSDASSNAMNKREQQLQLLMSVLEQSQFLNTIIMGDFNYDGDGEEEQTYQYSINNYALYQDAWATFRKNSQVFDSDEKINDYTYDPANNPCAKLTSLSQKSRRLDRILLNSKFAVSVEQADLLGKDYPIFVNHSIVFPSDHYGVQVDLQLDSLKPLVLKKCVKSAIAVVLSNSNVPISALDTIQTIRSQHDVQRLHRWMPHINLLYPFIEQMNIGKQLLQKLEFALSDVKPFEITLEKFDCFEDDHSLIYLKPVAKELQIIYSKLAELFPQCTTRNSYNPHLTVAQDFSSKQQQLTLLEELNQSWTPVSFTVTQLDIICRDSFRQDSKFESIFSIPLMNTDNFGWLKRIVYDLNKEWSLEVFGSSALGIPSDDIDLMLCINQVSIPSITELFYQIVNHPLFSQHAFQFRIITQNSLVPRLWIQLNNGVILDLIAVCTKDKQQQWILNGIKEVQYIKQSLTPALWERFQSLLPYIKQWAKQRYIQNNAQGYLGGVCYTLLVVNYLLHSKNSEDGDIEAFFRFYKEWDLLHKPVIFRGLHTNGKKEWLRISSPIYPYLNTARNITRSTSEIIRREFDRAYEIVTKKDWLVNSLFAARRVSSNDQKIVCKLFCKNNKHIDEVKGFINGKILQFILALEKRTLCDILVYCMPPLEIDNLAILRICVEAQNEKLEQLNKIIEIEMIAFIHTVQTTLKQNSISQDLYYSFEKD